MKLVVIEGKELDDLMFMSFRYAFGRRSYITSVCGDLLIRYAPDMNEHTKKAIAHEISIGINEGHYGMDMDKSGWLLVIEALGGGDVSDL